jgi:WD40 repeat protein
MFRPEPQATGGAPSGDIAEPGTQPIVAKHRRIRTLTDPGSNPTVSSVAFSPDGKILATANQDGVTYLWSIAMGRSRR